jgi:peptidoglycan-N-acetylglucosamine deacetylase
MKKAILTIDDAPSADFKNKVATLKKHNIAAVFFCTGSLIQKREKELIEAIQAGFILGNHSYNHYHFSKLTLKECERQITKASILIDELYRTAGVKRPVKWFRFPFGDKGDGRMGSVFEPESRNGKIKKHVIQNILSDHGYTFRLQEWIKYGIFSDFDIKNDIDWTWTFDLMEWSVNMSKPMMNLESVDDILKRMEESNPMDCRGSWKEPHWIGDPSSPEIILTHDHEENAAFFESLIERLLALGIEFPAFELILPGQ